MPRSCGPPRFLAHRQEPWRNEKKRNEAFFDAKIMHARTRPWRKRSSWRFLAKKSPRFLEIAKKSPRFQEIAKILECNSWAWRVAKRASKAGAASPSPAPRKARQLLRAFSRAPRPSGHTKGTGRAFCGAGPWWTYKWKRRQDLGNSAKILENHN